MSLLDKFKKPFEKKQQSAPEHAVGLTDAKEDAKKASKKDESVANKTKQAKPASKKVKDGTSDKAKSDIKDPTGQASAVIIRPLQTEKNSDLMMINKYVFEVSVNATKSEVKKAFKALYGIDPVSVNIMTRKGKSVRFGRISSRRKDWRRAIVTLKEGDKVEVFEGV